MFSCNKCNREYPSQDGYFYKRKNGSFSSPCKACAVAASALRYSLKKDSINEKRRLLNATDENFRNRKKESDKSSYLKHRDTRLKSFKEYRGRPEIKEKRRAYFNALRTEDFIEKKKMYLKKYHFLKMQDADFVEKKRALGREYWKKNPDKALAMVRNRRARLRGAIGSHTEKDILTLCVKQNYLCHWCGVDVTNNYTVDHVIPIIKGGSNDPANLVIACPSCNYSKGAKMPNEFIEYRKQFI